MLGATPLNRHQHLCCHYIVDPKRRFDFDNWAAAEAPHLRGAHWIMLSTDNRLLPIAKMNPWVKGFFHFFLDVIFNSFNIMLCFRFYFFYFLRCIDIKILIKFSEFAYFFLCKGLCCLIFIRIFQILLFKII